jgi:hypothetical protein
MIAANLGFSEVIFPVRIFQFSVVIPPGPISEISLISLVFQSLFIYQLAEEDQLFYLIAEFRPSLVKFSLIGHWLRPQNKLTDEFEDDRPHAHR